VNRGHPYYAEVGCPECNTGRLAFAVRRDGQTCFLLCLECGANYDEPPAPADLNPAYDSPPDELSHPPRWATREEIEARGWGRSVAADSPEGAGPGAAPDRGGG
jgi:hypothetical protein